jgi:hypothetical protein
MRHTVTMILTLGLLVAACGDPSAVPIEAADGPGAQLVRCDELERVEAPDDWYADEPMYVANEMPIEDVQEWASGRPGFQELWIDRERNGWLTVAFTEDVEARQAEIEERFPDDGVVAVEVPRTRDELEALQRRVVEELSFDTGSGMAVNYGVVSVHVGQMTAERLDEVADKFGDEPICVEGTDPADAPPEGPQPTEGDGWRLLEAQRDAGEPYRTGIATDESQYGDLWREAGLSGEAHEVDFDAEVVVWFGAVYGSGCDALRLDDVVVDGEASLVHADIVLVDPPPACNDDANPYAFVVSVERDRLPAGPFAIQLGADDPPPGAPQERTYVDVDLTRTGAVAGPEDLRSGTRDDLGGSGALRSGDVVEPGYPARYALDVRCGATWLGELNRTVWRTDDVDSDPGHVPPAWAEAARGDVVEVEVELSTDPPTITAEANGYAVEYEPASEPMPGCD